jgi:signal transduction histidine kinase/DNA-binding response OmpR family regulator/streptogramin lyase
MYTYNMRRLFIGIFLIFSDLLFQTPALADSPFIVKVQHFSLGEGLPERAVLAIGQDRQGFIWIGTQNNAYRFDSYAFKELPQEPSVRLSPFAPIINTIRIDPDGNMWFFETGLGGNSKIEILVPGQKTSSSFETLFRQKLPFDLSDFTNSTRRLIVPAQPTDPILIYNSDGSVWRYENKGRFKRLYKHPIPSYPDNLLVTPTGTILLNYPPPSTSSNHQGRNELIEIEQSGRIRRRRTIPANLNPIWVDQQGNIYLTHFNSSAQRNVIQPQLTAHRLDKLLYRLSPEGALTNLPITFSKSPFPAQYNFSDNKMMYDTKHGLFWFLGKNVLFAWHPKYGIVFDLADSGFPIASLIGLNYLFIDRTGTVWISTHNGFLQLSLQPNHFERYFYTPDKETTLPVLSTRGIVQIDDLLWINASYSWVMDLKTKRTRKINIKGFGPAIRGHDNQIWTANDSLIQINPTTLVSKKFGLLGTNTCWAMWQDGRHNLWLGHDRGLSYFDTKHQQIKQFTSYNQFQELATNHVNGFFPDSAVGGIWLAASSGLYLLDTLRGITARYSSQDSPPHYLPYDRFTFVHPDRDQPGIYWLTTRGGGLIRWERQTGRWQQFTQQDGLSNNELYSIHEDNSGRLWLPSNYGLNRFQKKNHQTQVFLPKDGIAHEEFNLTSYFQSPDGQLFLGGLNGVTAFRPNKQIPEKATIVPLIVTRYEQLNANTGQRTDHLPDFNRDQQIVVPPQNRSFSLSFALLDYRFGRQFRLNYRIVGWQNYWTSQLQPDVSINGLPPGSYKLQVRAQNPSGQWASETVTILITILKPFYLQDWFLILGILALGWAVFGVFRWRNNRLVQETKRLETEVARRTAQIENDKALIQQQAADLQASATLKSRFFANVSHEFRTPLTLLLGPLAYLLKHLSDPTLVRLIMVMDRNARQLLTMVSDLLDLSKLDANQMQLVNRPTDLCLLINQTTASFAPQAGFIGIQLTVEGTEVPIWVLLDGIKVETVLKNLLANALQFTPATGAVTVRVSKPADWIRIEVSDTGSGIHPNDLPHIFEQYYQSQQPDAPLRGGTGIGLALSHEYCTLWGGELTVKSELGKGSTFAFTLPLQPATPQNATPVAQPQSHETLPKENKNTPNLLAPKVLLVEDNLDMTDYLKTILSAHYVLHTTHNGQEAWQWLNEQPTTAWPRLIITDLMMPDMDGLTLVDLIRQHPHLRLIPVLMLTARTSLEVKLQALQLGVADYVTKPFDQDELITRINNLLERSQERTVWGQLLPSESVGSSSVPMDTEWLQQIQQLVLKNLTNSIFQVHSMADAVHSSERQLYRRLKKLTGFSPHQFVQEIRLQAAREWLEIQKYSTVKEVCYAVGFQDVVYFSRLFLQRFGRYPVSYLRTTDETSSGNEAPPYHRK